MLIQDMTREMSVDAVDDAGYDVGEIGLGIDAGQLAGLDERGDGGPVLGTAIGAGEECVLAFESQRPDCPLDDIVVDLDTTVVEEQG